MKMLNKNKTTMEQFRKDVLEGLSKSPQKTLPSKYFYDALGSQIFVKIMGMPEYYLTDAEMEIFGKKTDELITAIGVQKEVEFDVVELGAGDGTKTLNLLKRLVCKGYRFNYLPVDISEDALVGLQNMLQKELPSLSLLPQPGDYFERLGALATRKKPMILLFLGSNLGNLVDARATDFLGQLAHKMKTNDTIILGLDLRKSADKIMPAYNDAQGYTAHFNLNLLTRINRELDGNFDVNLFEHAPHYDELEGIAKSFLRSKVAQEVTVSGHKFSFAAGETIHTEISRKYDDAILENILADSGLRIHAKLQDHAKLFADYILKKL